MFRSIFLLTIIGLFSLSLSAQYRPLDIEVTSLPLAGTGGLNAPQFSEVDLNNDGIQDLLIYDRAGQIALPMLNGGTTNTVDYSFAPQYMSHFPQGSENFMLLRDYNCDGIEDLFYFTRTQAQPSGGVAVLKGYYDSNNEIRFEAVDSTLFFDNPVSSQTEKLFIFNSDLPAIDDIDGDGDMDILAFSTDFLFFRNVYWYKNMSAENGHDCDSLQYVLEHECWGLFSETGSNNEVFISASIDSCADNTFWPRSPRHVGSTLTAIDYNGDGYKDMLMGDATVNTLNMMTTTEISDTLIVTSQDSAYPSYDQSADIFTFPASFFIDVDNDGNLDMLASPNETATGEAVTDSVVWYYRNTQNNSNISLELQDRKFLTNSMLDRGQNAFPAFFDYNADSLMDIVVGHYGFCQSDRTYRYGLMLLENTGTASNPSFAVVDGDYANLSNLKMSGLHPTFGDLDDDGDMDMILGNSEGELVYLENTAGSGNTATWGSPTLNYASIDVGTVSAPQLVDLDRDKDLDLVIGEYNGNINYFENTGSASSPTFGTSPTALGLGLFDISALPSGSRQSSPYFVDENGEYKLYIGHREKGIILLNNVDNDILGTYDTVSLELNGLYAERFAAPAITDLNNDGNLDIVIGNLRGGLMFFTEGSDPSSISNIKTYNPDLIKAIFPNPTQAVLYVELAQAKEAHLEIYNSMGQLVWRQQNAQNQLIQQVSTENLAQGIYLLRVEQHGQVATKRFVKR